MKKEIKRLELLAYFMAVYCVFTVMQNLFEMKTLGTEVFAFGGGGGLLSWATFMIIDNFLTSIRRCHAVHKAYPEQVNGISSRPCFLN